MNDEDEDFNNEEINEYNSNTNKINKLPID